VLELREIRANRVGITFKDKFERDPFLFQSPGLLLRMLYAITRPVQRPVNKKLRPVDVFVPARTFVASSGQRWGNDSVEPEPR
jgi:hypothetical protein